MIRHSMNNNQLRNQNLKLVLQQVFNNRPTSRIEIARNLQLNKSTVSSLYNSLMAAGYLIELGLGEASTAGGRKPMLVDINKNYGYTVTFDLGYRHLHVIANYLNGDVWQYEQTKVKDKSIHEMVDLIRNYIAKYRQNDPTENGLLGLCFSIHGIVVNNQIKHSPWIDMDGVDLYALFTKAYGIPVILENEANLSAIFERDFNGARTMNSMVTISIHKGIGAGIILKRELFRGEHGEAGEVGCTMANIAINSGDGMQPQHIENLCSEDAIIAQVEKHKGLNNLNREDLVEFYKKEDQAVTRILRQFAIAIAGLIYNMVSLLDPDEIFLNSPLIEEIPELLQGIQTAYESVSQTKLTIHLTSNTTLATVLGGCSLITHHVFGLEKYDMDFSKSKI
ncbi:ROK family protein [Sporolactobacillus shoreicorticis]|uniref:ROK family protein n=1 Tax=Sporolactobacillus shoreicorticis TaxID=1923877 RepID=A0ABW5S9M8_9BACL|nr:ROK family protein [Sporolactobacillus shoreicorticis]MCO7127908.1 ROK family protein [Sporolactobacillus shoreicorticis]